MCYALINLLRQVKLMLKAARRTDGSTARVVNVSQINVSFFFPIDEKLFVFIN